MPDQLTADEVLRGTTAQAIVELASRLVATPSSQGDERQVMDVARRFLDEQGVAVQDLSRDPKRPNLVATVGRGRPLLVLNGHLDTVPVADPGRWESDPLTPTVRGDRLYGLGALDMKGPCAVMMLAAAALNRHADRLRGSLQLQLVSDEETGCFYGTIFMLEQIKAGALPRPDMTFMGEPTDLRISSAERGSFKFNITFYGRAAHTALARVEGINPIALAARAVLAIEKPLPRYHPEVGYGVISVNIIQAGSFPSTVPGECTLLVDRRMLPGETAESCLADVRREIEEALKECPEARFELAPMVDANGRQRYSPPNITPRDSPLVQAMAQAHQAVTDRPGEFLVDWYGATDGRLYRYEGIDTVTYGPTGAHMHGAKEYVEVPSLETQLKVYVTAALDLLTARAPA